MSTLREAAQLLSNTKSLRGLTLLSAPLGFGAPSALDASTAELLGADHNVRRAEIATGPGTLRALLVDTHGDAAARETVARLATRLANRVPHLLWLVLAVHRTRGEVVLAAPAPGARIAGLALETARVLDSDAETFAAMRDACGGSDLLVHHRWRELLGRDALTRRFYRELERAVFDLAATARGDADAATRRGLALLCASRLLFLSFLEAKGWLDNDRGFLRRAFETQCMRGGDVHGRLLEPLFFGTLNTPVARRASASRALGQLPFLNGGLFARTATEKRHRRVRFTDDALGALIGNLLGRYRVTAREEAATWSEAAVDPEMLGRAFESLMASEDRRASGTFYTPAALIQRVGDESLRELLLARGAPATAFDALATGAQLNDEERRRLAVALGPLRVLDPACGSGSFLVHALERLADLAAVAGDSRPASLRRRDVLTRSIFGVDVNPTAVWLCELRLWLSVVIESGEQNPLRVTPLPNLDRNIRIGDALSGAGFDGDCDATAGAWGAVCRDGALSRTRVRYARSTGARKAALARWLDRHERNAAVAHAEHALATCSVKRKEQLCALRGHDLFAARLSPSSAEARSLRDLRCEVRTTRRRIEALRAGGPLPFSFAVHFGEVAAAGGFDLVVGNPPWVRLHHIPEASRAALRARYRTFREAAWMAGAMESGAARGFAAQVDLAALFVERSVALVAPLGFVALLVPAKLWRSLAGGGVRALLREHTTLRALEDWAESPTAFDAAVYPAFVMAQRTAGATVTRPDAKPALPAKATSPVRVAVHRRADALVWAQQADALALDATRGAPWLLLPPEAREGFDRLVAAGTPLSRTSFGRPMLGVKSGCNNAFIVTPRPGWSNSRDERWPVRAGTREGLVESHVFRPLLRGEHTRPWRATPDDDVLIWTHDAHDRPVAALPPAAAAWLAPWRSTLAARADARSGPRWWSLFRTEAARADAPRVVWSDMGRTPRALVLQAGDPTVPLNSCYVVRAPTLDDAYALCAILNSALAAAWLAAIAEPARGGYHRYLGWTVARLPMPRDWPHAVRLLAPLARAAEKGLPPHAATLAQAALRAFRVRHSTLAPLLTWCLR